MPALWIGTSGWVYKHWTNGAFYPSGLSSQAQLPFYAERFDTVEINYSFYQLPERSVFESWRRKSPPGFLFAAKASRYLTHMKKLKEPTEPLQRLMDRAAGLEEKVGPILFQFPAQWRLNLDRLRAFMDALQPYRDQYRFAFEFRHQTWLVPPVFDLLEYDGCALCLPYAPGMPLDLRLTTSWTYIRFHTGQQGIGLNDAELQTWADRIRAFQAQNADVYAYFNNDPRGAAIRDAAHLLEMFGRTSPELAPLAAHPQVM